MRPELVDSTDWVVCSRSGRPVLSFEDPAQCAQWLRDRPDGHFVVKCVERQVREVPCIDIWVPAMLGEFDQPPFAPRLPGGLSSTPSRC